MVDVGMAQERFIFFTLTNGRGQLVELGSVASTKVLTLLLFLKL